MKLEEVKEDLGKSVSLDMVLIRAVQFNLIENPEQNNVGGISSRIARRVANLSGLIA